MNCYHGTNESTGIVHAVVSAKGWVLLGDPLLEGLFGAGARSLCGTEKRGATLTMREGAHTLRGVTCKRCRQVGGLT